MTKLDFTNIDITSERDWRETLELWEGFFDDPILSRKYRILLSRLNVIVGFGRGFWSGKPAYMYLTYHQDTKRYYWYLRNPESDYDVFFYEISPDAEIFKMLETLSIQEHFHEYDEALNFRMMSGLSLGVHTSMPDTFRPVELDELFGEDTLHLREALMQFRPGSCGRCYPHTEFHRRFFAPMAREKKRQEAHVYNEGDFHVFEEDGSLWIRLGNDTFKLKEPSET